MVQAFARPQSHIGISLEFYFCANSVRRRSDLGCLFLNNNNLPSLSQLQVCYSCQCHTSNIGPLEQCFSNCDLQTTGTESSGPNPKSTKSEFLWMRLMNSYILRFPKVILLPPVRKALPMGKTVFQDNKNNDSMPSVLCN